MHKQQQEQGPRKTVFAKFSDWVAKVAAVAGIGRFFLALYQAFHAH